MTSSPWMLISFFMLTSLMISLVALIYIACRHIETIESQLINCKFVQGNRSMYSTAGILGKMMRLCGIAGMLSTPNFYIRRNLADPIDIQSIPQKTKHLLLFFWYCLKLSVSSLLIFEGFTRYFERG